MEFRRELKIVITQVHLIVLFVLILHIAIPIVLNNFHPPSLNLYTNRDESSGEEYLEVDLQNSKASEDGRLVEVVPSTGEALEVVNPDIYIYRLYQEAKEATPNKLNKIDELSDLLASPTSQKVAKMPINRVVIKNGLSGLSNSSPAIKAKKAEELSYEKILSKNDIVEIEKNKLKTIVQGLNSKFQKCYDDELFKDELLTGKLIISLKSNDVVVQFNGIGKNQSIENLKACVKKYCSIIKVPAFLQDNTIKFNFNLTGTQAR